MEQERIDTIVADLNNNPDAVIVIISNGSKITVAVEGTPLAIGFSLHTVMEENEDFYKLLLSSTMTTKMMKELNV